jgi:flavin reductase (DIM6/NTAB) family NADH-FMN oxidoreductase RutF
MHIALDPAELAPANTHKLTIGTIVPRPIAWTTSVGPTGRVNLAPFSYFLGCHSYVPALAVSIDLPDVI